LDFWAKYFNSHIVDTDEYYLFNVWKAFRSLKWFAEFHAKAHGEGAWRVDSCTKFIKFLEDAFVYDLINRYQMALL